MKKFIRLTTTLFIFVAFQNIPIFSMKAEEIKTEQPTQAQRVKERTIKINLKDGTSFEIPAQAAIATAELFKEHKFFLINPEKQWEDKFYGFDDEAVTFVCKLLPDVYKMQQEKKLANLPGFIKNKMRYFDNLNLQEVWKFAGYILCIDLLLNALAQVLAEKYTSPEFLKNEYKTGYFDNFQPQNILLGAVKQQIWESYPNEYNLYQSTIDERDFYSHALNLSSDKKIFLAIFNTRKNIKILKLLPNGFYERLQRIIAENDDIFYMVKLSNDSKIIVAMLKNDIKIWERQSDNSYILRQTINMKIRSLLSISNNGKTFTIYSGKTVKIFKRQSNNGEYVLHKTITITINESDLYTAAISQDTQTLISHELHSKLTKIWHRQTNDTYSLFQTISLAEQKITNTADAYSFKNLLLSRDKKTIVFLLEDEYRSYRIQIWQLQNNATYKCTQTITKKTEDVAMPVISNDKQFIVFGVGNNIELWKLQTNGKYQHLQSIKTPNNPRTGFRSFEIYVKGLTLSDDKKILISISSDNTINIWQLQNFINDYNFDQTMEWLMKKLGIKPAQQTFSSSELVKKDAEGSVVMKEKEKEKE